MALPMLWKFVLVVLSSLVSCIIYLSWSPQLLGRIHGHIRTYGPRGGQFLFDGINDIRQDNNALNDTPEEYDTSATPSSSVQDLVESPESNALCDVALRAQGHRTREGRCLPAISAMTDAAPEFTAVAGTSFFGDPISHFDDSHFTCPLTRCKLHLRSLVALRKDMDQIAAGHNGSQPQGMAAYPQWFWDAHAVFYHLSPVPGDYNPWGGPAISDPEQTGNLRHSHRPGSHWTPTQPPHILQGPRSIPPPGRDGKQLVVMFSAEALTDSPDHGFAPFNAESSTRVPRLVRTPVTKRRGVITIEYRDSLDNGGRRNDGVSTSPDAQVHGTRIAGNNDGYHLEGPFFRSSYAGNVFDAVHNGMPDFWRRATGAGTGNSAASMSPFPLSARVWNDIFPAELPLEARARVGDADFAHASWSSSYSSGTQSNREGLIQALQAEGLNVAIFGGKGNGMRNVGEPLASAPVAAQHAKMRSYRFHLAFENHRTEGYVTEKFYWALLRGQVPVVWGAPDIARHAPSPDSYIDASHFSSARDLARHLLFLSQDTPEANAAYSKLHEWRHGRPFAEYGDVFRAELVTRLWLANATSTSNGIDHGAMYKCLLCHAFAELHGQGQLDMVRPLGIRPFSTGYMPGWTPDGKGRV